jgi:hypothetical protein
MTAARPGVGDDGSSLPAAQHDHDVQGDGDGHQCPYAYTCALTIEHFTTPLLFHVAAGNSG